MPNGSVSYPDISVHERITRVEARQDATDRRVERVERESSQLVERFAQLLGRLETVIWVIGSLGVGVPALWWLFQHLR